MAPADSKDWLFAAVALTSAATAPAASAAQSDQAGVVTGVLSSTWASPDGQTNEAAVVLGNAVRAGETFRTGPEGIIHILFLDQSSLTLGANSSLTLEHFSHDAESRTGKIGILLNAGSLRVVGGLNSKNNPTQVRTSDALVEILGGISTVQNTDGRTDAAFLFGTQMTVTDQTGTSQTVVRPGFAVSTVAGYAGAPEYQTPQQLALLSAFFEARSAGAGASSASQNVTPLVSTSDVGPNANGGAPSAIAPDRLSSNNSTLVGSVMSGGRADAINPSQVPLPVDNIRTQPPVVSS